MKTVIWKVTSSILLFTWLFLIYCFSDQANSNEVTKEVFGNFNYFVRKGAHMFEYAVLFIFSLNFQSAFSKNAKSFLPAILCGRRVKLLPKPRVGLLLRAYFLPVMFSLLYAVSDELHQSIVPGRSAAFSDVLVDSSGIACAVLFCLLFK